MGITFGSASAPSQITVNFDALFSQSLAAYRKELVDNIGATNAFFHEMLKRDLYESQEGGTDIRTPLLYALTAADSYDGYDELSTLPTDGVTESVFEWRQCAAAISYNMKEVKQNKNGIKNIVKTKIKQAEMGLQEYFSQALNWGSLADGGAGTLITPRTSGVNGSLSIDPLFKLIAFDPTTSVAIGNINQNTSSWWRNKTKTSAATTYDAFLLEIDNIFNSCALGSGGKPKLIVCDQVTYELFVHALYQKFRYTSPTVDEAYPFENIVYRGAHWVMEDKTPDVYTGAIATSGANTYGTMGFINPEFFKIIYESTSDFAMLKDDNGKTFAKPINGDSRVGHLAWMGNTTIQNRRKQGVMGKIARSMT